MGLRIIVCGSREVFNYEEHAKFLDYLHKKYEIIEIIQGGAMGADSVAKLWALKNGIDLVEFIYNTSKGVSGGPRRNARQLNYLKSQDVYKTAHRIAVVAFPGTEGTADMKGRAEKSGVKVINYRKV
jgi:hypothetical protein